MRGRRRTERPPDFGLKITLDWPGYFRAFCTDHGGDPVVHEGRLLFRDGWRYSMSDHRGPEWPPPEDLTELKRLMTTYWHRKRVIVAHDVRQLEEAIKVLANAQRDRPTPLQRVVRYRDETGKVVTHRGPLNLDVLRSGRLAEMKRVLVKCDRMLAELYKAEPIQPPEVVDVR